MPSQGLRGNPAWSFPSVLGTVLIKEEKVTCVHGEGFVQEDVNFWVLSAVKTTKIPQKCLSSGYWKLNPGVIRGWGIPQKISKEIRKGTVTVCHGP